MDFKAVSFLQGFRSALMRLILGSAAFVAAAGFVGAQSPAAAVPTETVLYRFKGAPDGFRPAAGLISNSNGALFGTTQQGGTGGTSGLGTVFKLKPPAPGQTLWTEKVLYSFKGAPDGFTPAAGLIFDSNGALYGTTARGGISDAGTCSS